MVMLFCLLNWTGFERERRAESGGSGSGSVPVPVNRIDSCINKEDSWKTWKWNKELSHKCDRFIHLMTVLGQFFCCPVQLANLNCTRLDAKLKGVSVRHLARVWTIESSCQLQRAARASGSELRMKCSSQAKTIQRPKFAIRDRDKRFVVRKLIEFSHCWSVE